jgi:hypothetical protein
VNEDDSEIARTPYVYYRSPSIVSARFTPLGLSIEVLFDQVRARSLGGLNTL